MALARRHAQRHAPDRFHGAEPTFERLDGEDRLGRGQGIAHGQDGLSREGRPSFL